MFIQLETSLMTFLLSIFQTNTVQTTPEHDPLLALFDVRYNFERLIYGHTGSEKYFVRKNTNYLPNFERDCTRQGHNFCLIIVY
jgi:hypothetical protein